MKFKSNIINNSTASINSTRSFACGGKVRKGEEGLYNRIAARKQKQKFWNDETNEYGDTYANHSFADIAERLSKESSERPNDPISKRGLLSSMSRLQQAQETVRQQNQVGQEGVQY